MQNYSSAAKAEASAEWQKLKYGETKAEFLARAKANAANAAKSANASPAGGMSAKAEVAVAKTAITSSSPAEKFAFGLYLPLAQAA